MSSIRSMAGTVPSGYRHDHAPPGFALGEFLQLLAARRRLILQVAVATVLAAALTALLLPTRYSSSALVMLDQRRNTVTDLSAVLSQLPSDPAGLQNQLQILTSRQLAGAVIARLALYNDPEFNRALAPPGLGDLPDAVTALLNPGGAAASDDPQRRHDRIVDAFLKHITAEIEGISTVITVTASSRDPVKAALIANTLVDQYGKAQVATKVGATNGTTDWLTTRIHDLAQQLQVQQEAVQRYKAQHDLTDTGPGNSLVDQQLAGINAQIVQARSDLAEKQAVYDRVTALVAAGDTADVSQVVSSPLIVQLRTQQADLIRAHLRPPASPDAGDRGAEARTRPEDRPGSEPHRRQHFQRSDGGAGASEIARGQPGRCPAPGQRPEHGAGAAAGAGVQRRLDPWHV